MIISTIGELEKQIKLDKNLQDAISFLKSVVNLELQDGRIEIDGKRLYALAQSYTGKPDLEKPRFEVHRKYLDLQYLVSGKEYFGWSPIENLLEQTPYNDEKDVQHGIVDKDKFTLARLQPGQLAVVYPSDAHAPGLADGQPAMVKKVVVKVLLES